MKNVEIVETYDMVAQQDWLALENIIGGSEGRIVCGWCYSDRSHVVLDGLRGAW